MSSNLTQAGPPTDRLYTAREVAERLHVSVKTVKREVIRGNLRALKVGKGVTSPLRIAESEIQRYLEAHQTWSAPQEVAG